MFWKGGCTLPTEISGKPMPCEFGLEFEPSKQTTSSWRWVPESRIELRRKGLGKAHALQLSGRIWDQACAEIRRNLHIPSRRLPARCPPADRGRRTPARIRLKQAAARHRDRSLSGSPNCSVQATQRPINREARTRMPSKRAAMKDSEGSITASAKVWPCTLRSPMVRVSCSGGEHNIANASLSNAGMQAAQPRVAACEVDVWASAGCQCHIRARLLVVVENDANHAPSVPWTRSRTGGRSRTGYQSRGRPPGRCSTSPHSTCCGHRVQERTMACGGRGSAPMRCVKLLLRRQQ